MPKTYTFHVSLPGTGRAWRKIEMLADQTLNDLHHAILETYGWDGDHLYSFFMSGEAWDRSSEYCLPEGVHPWGVDDFEEDEAELEWKDEDELDMSPEERETELRELFGDGWTLEEMETELKAFFEDFIAEEKANAPGDVRTTTIESLGLEIGKTFMYLFDYGDSWKFKVRVHDIDLNAPEDEYPKVVQSVGKAPSQYPDWD